MPGFEQRDRYQVALLWAATGAFDDFAVPVVAAPVEIRVRWVDGQSESLDPDGQTVSLDGTAVVNQFVPIGSRMWLGTLDQWYAAPGSGGDDDQVREVKTYNGVPDIKVRNLRYKLGLMKWRSKT